MRFSMRYIIDEADITTFNEYDEKDANSNALNIMVSGYRNDYEYRERLLHIHISRKNFYFSYM